MPLLIPIPTYYVAEIVNAIIREKEKAIGFGNIVKMVGAVQN
jgi:hypothetical protein